jgi:hypothetical protein
MGRFLCFIQPVWVYQRRVAFAIKRAGRSGFVFGEFRHVICCHGSILRCQRDVEDAEAARDVGQVFRGARCVRVVIDLRLKTTTTCKTHEAKRDIIRDLGSFRRSEIKGRVIEIELGLRLQKVSI